MHFHFVNKTTSHNFADRFQNYSYIILSTNVPVYIIYIRHGIAVVISSTFLNSQYIQSSSYFATEVVPADKFPISTSDGVVMEALAAPKLFAEAEAEAVVAVVAAEAALIEIK